MTVSPTARWDGGEKSWDGGGEEQAKADRPRTAADVRALQSLVTESLFGAKMPEVQIDGERLPRAVLSAAPLAHPLRCPMLNLAPTHMEGGASKLTALPPANQAS